MLRIERVWFYLLLLIAFFSSLGIYKAYTFVDYPDILGKGFCIPGCVMDGYESYACKICVIKPGSGIYYYHMDMYIIFMGFLALVWWMVRKEQEYIMPSFWSYKEKDNSTSIEMQEVKLI